MSRVLVVSDVHLDPSDPDRYALVVNAIKTCAADYLVLAGDIFEAWVGDDGAESIDIWFLAQLVEAFPRVSFIPGNRDFLVSPNFLKYLGITHATNIQTESYTIIHGDELCTDDLDYQNFRNMVRSEHWQQDFLAKSLMERQSIARQLREASKENQENRPQAIGDATPATVTHFFEACGTPLLIHGHTHRPGMHLDQPKLRAVTSDWNVAGRVILVEQTGHEIIISLVLLSKKEPKLIQQATRISGTPEWNLNSRSGDSIK